MLFCLFKICFFVGAYNVTSAVIWFNSIFFEDGYLEDKFIPAVCKLI